LKNYVPEKMTTIQIQPDTKVPVEDVLSGIASLNTPELEDFFQKVSQVLAERKAPHLSSSEAELLKKINTGYPVEMAGRYEYLSTQKDKRALSPVEQQELVKITDNFEILDTERLESLLKLAHFRDISLEDLLKKLKQPSPSK